MTRVPRGEIPLPVNGKYLNEWELSPQEAYEAYLRIWHMEHKEGCPVCFEEFMADEYEDADYMAYLRAKME